MIRNILVLAFLIFIPASSFATQPVIDLSSEHGIIVRLHQELSAVQALANEARDLSPAERRAFNYQDFNRAVQLLKDELVKAEKSGRLIHETAK